MTGTYLYETQDIARRTGVNVGRIRHLGTKLSDILHPFRVRGMNGVYLYDAGGLAVWDRIIQLSNEGFGPQAIHKNLSITLKTIESESEHSIQPTGRKGDSGGEAVPENDLPNVAALYQTMLDHMKEAHASILAEKEKAIQRLEEDRTRFLLGPGDRSKLDRLTQDQKKRRQLLKDLSETSIFQLGKRKRLEKQLLNMELDIDEYN